MAEDSIKIEYEIKEITTKLNEQHDTILLTEIVEFCGRNDLLEYKVSVDTLREALNFYFEHKDRQKGKWIKHLDDLFPEESTMECSVCHEEQDIRCDENFRPHCGADMREEEE